MAIDSEQQQITYRIYENCRSRQLGHAVTGTGEEDDQAPFQ